MIYTAPEKIDDGTKKSAKGLIKVIKSENGYEAIEQIPREEFLSDDNELKPIYKDGELISTITLDQIRENIASIL